MGFNASGALNVTSFHFSHIRPFTSFYQYQTRVPIGGLPHWFKNTGDYFNQPYYAPYNKSTAWEDGVLQKANVVFLKRLREADHSFQGGVFFGEIVPTLRMLTRPFSSLRNRILDYSKSVRGRTAGMKDGPKLRKVLGDTWLEFSFGWRPLLMDVKDASLALIQIYANLRKTKVKANAEKEESTTKLQNDLYPLNNIMYKVYTDESFRFSVKLYGKLNPLPNAESGIGLLDRLVKKSGFDLASFIPTVWELIPYSFLIDYFVNVGEVLEAYNTDTSVLSWMSKVEKRQSNVTERAEINSTYMAALHAPTDQWGPTSTYWLTGNGGAAENEWFQLIRWSHEPITYPGLRFDTGLSSTQFANIGALLAGSRKLRG